MSFTLILSRYLEFMVLSFCHWEYARNRITQNFANYKKFLRLESNQLLPSLLRFIHIAHRSLPRSTSSDSDVRIWVDLNIDCMAIVFCATDSFVGLSRINWVGYSNIHHVFLLVSCPRPPDIEDNALGPVRIRKRYIKSFMCAVHHDGCALSCAARVWTRRDQLLPSGIRSVAS